MRNHSVPSARDTGGDSGPAFLILFLSALLCLTAGCHNEAAPPAAPDEGANRNAALSPGQAERAAADAVDKGDLKFRYQPRKGFRAGAASRKVGSNQEAVEKIIATLNDRIALPFDIVVSAEDCDGPDAFYAAETHQLTICHQLVDEYYDLFSRKVKDKAKLEDAVRGAVASTFFHELGHALVDAWQLPITGKEEDAVDQLSTLVLIDRTEEGEQMALDGALSFKLYADLDKYEKKIYWDEHSLDEQRFYDTICLIYGHDPDKYAYLVKDGTLPDERAELCREDFPKIERSWRQLLSPYIKKPAEADSNLRLK
jgi:hypothetical protein